MLAGLGEKNKTKQTQKKQPIKKDMAITHFGSGPIEWILWFFLTVHLKEVCSAKSCQQK